MQVRSMPFGDRIVLSLRVGDNALSIQSVCLLRSQNEQNLSGNEFPCLSFSEGFVKLGPLQPVHPSIYITWSRLLV